MIRYLGKKGIQVLDAGDDGPPPEVPSGPLYEHTIFMQTGVPSYGAQSFGTSGTNLLNWGSALSSDGLSLAMSTGDGVWSSSNRSRIYIPEGVSRVSFNASFLVDTENMLTQIGLYGGGFATSHPQYQTRSGVHPVGHRTISALSMHADRMPVAAGDYLAFFLIKSGANTATLKAGIDSNSYAPSTKIHVKMY